MSAFREVLDAVLRPRSIAILGASDDSTRIGGRPIRYMKAGDFSGQIYPVNPNRPTVQDLPAFASLDDVPGDIDFALIALQAPMVVEAARAAAGKGAKACLVFSSGFAEAGADGAAMQDALGAVARETGMRIIGPNCLGLFNAAHGFYPTFTSSLDLNLPHPGHVAIVSQSGAYGSHLFYLAEERGLGVRYWITTGNECDVQVAEAIGWAAEDPEIKVILAYAEGVRDGALLIDALERARRNRKPVVFMKVGRSEIGAEAVSSHTAALAGADAAYEAALSQFGAHRARTSEEMVDIAYAASRGVYPTGRKLGIVTISGGAGVLMADTAQDYDLDVAPMPEAAQKKLKDTLPFAAVRNPVDITAQAFNDLSLVTKNLQIILSEGGYDAVAAFFTMVPSAPMIAEPVRAALRDGLKGHDDKLIILSILGPETIKQAYRDDGLLLFEDPSRAISAIAALCRFGERFASAPAERPTPAPPAALSLPPGPIGEADARVLLRQAGLPVVAEYLVGDDAEAERAAREIAGPLALKVSSPDITHKTELGGVRLNVPPDEAAFACDRLLADVAAAAPDAQIDGVLVSPMVSGGVEAILGARRDPVFGAIVMVGLGGVFAEVLQDVAFRVAPFGPDEARAMIRDLRGYPVLEGARGRPPADIDALAAALSALSLFAATHADEIESIDVNPVTVLPAGQGALALDALIIRRG
ncbi:MAG: acetate--CoA ligase family protein [Alphaproteobacteria bacterium]|nr:acetate--CoA ligase family protein [Alphaproteobacteria bacterium]